jgi:ribosome maturation factor RimP
LSKKIEKIVFDIANPLAAEMGYEVVDCEYIKIATDVSLTIYIDKDGGVDLDDCEKLSRAVDEALDEIDPIDSEYVLSVSSPGLDRPIKTEKDFERNLEKKVYIKLYRAINKKKEMVAVLKKYDEKSIDIMFENKPYTLERSTVAVIKQHVEF